MARDTDSVGDIIDSIKKRWKIARTLEEINERVKSGLEDVRKDLKFDLNDLRNLFKKYPEIFLTGFLKKRNGENIRKYITDKYLRANTYLSTDIKNSEQVGHFNDTYSVMERAAEQLYKDLLPKLSVEAKEQKTIVQEEKGEEKEEETEEIDALHLFDDDEFENKQEKKEEERKMEENMKENAKKRRISQKMRNNLANDTTPIEEFLPENSQKFKGYLQERGVRTLGDYLRFFGESYQALFKWVNTNCHDVYEKLNQNIIAYADLHKETKQPKKRDDFFSNLYFSNLRERPCEDFRKDSETMNRISDEFVIFANQQLDLLSKDPTVSEEDLNKKYGDLVSEYHKIIDEKREQLSREETVNRLRGQIGDDAKYHHKQFTQDLEPGVHKHHGGGREL